MNDEVWMRSVLLGDLKERFDRRAEDASEAQCENCRGDEDPVLDGIDRFSRHLRQGGEIGLCEAEPCPLFAEAVAEA